MDRQLRISDLARMLGRQPRTIRRWEREGRILPARRAPVTDYRVWAVEEAQQIERLLEMALAEKEGQR